jgi:hypothetical protein
MGRGLVIWPLLTLLVSVMGDGKPLEFSPQAFQSMAQDYEAARVIYKEKDFPAAIALFDAIVSRLEQVNYIPFKCLI